MKIWLDTFLIFKVPGFVLQLSSTATEMMEDLLFLL